MLNSLTPFLIQWAVTALSLWVASYLFKGLRFEGTGSLVVANTPAEFAAQIKAEFDVYKKVVAAQKLALD